MVHRSAAEGFEREAGTYASARPAYHRELVARFVERHGRRVDGSAAEVVELGAGTGIFTRQLVDAGCVPVAVEPVEAMRERLAVDCPGVAIVAGSAEHTGLPDACADTVVAAQAFHWFDHAAALDEIDRILRPGGALVCVWNVRDDSVPWAAAYTDLMDRHAGDTPRHRTMVWRRAIDADTRFVADDDWSIPNPRPTTVDGIVDRALSTSFVGALPADERDALLAEVRALVEPLGPTLDFPYRSELQAWHHP